MTSLDFQYGSRTVQDFVFLYQHGQLNLEPGFQRNSVWNERDRQKLIESLCTNCPIPSVFLYAAPDEHGALRYDVIDGKQRLEAVLYFQGARGFRGKRFSVRMQLQGDTEPVDYDWNRLCRSRQQHVLTGYKIQTVEVAGELADIIDPFVRINSTGKRPTTAEKRHARYYHSPFLRLACKIAERRRRMFLENGIMTASQVSRMKHVELTSELLASVVSKGLINKKSALDGIADFYSLFMFLWNLDQRKAILTDARRNRSAHDLLRRLTAGVDEVRLQVRKAKGAKPEQRLFADYLLTIHGDTDSLAMRQRRQALLEELLGGIFERKDEKRLFTSEQRRILWNRTDVPRCRYCSTRLDWTNFAVDHVRSHATGGRTELGNAALTCRPCNSRKGARVAA